MSHNIPDCSRSQQYPPGARVALSAKGAQRFCQWPSLTSETGLVCSISTSCRYPEYGVRWEKTGYLAWLEDVDLRPVVDAS